MRAVATTGRDAHHVLAAKPHPITINAPDSAPEETRACNPAKTAEMPHTVVQNRPPA